MKMEYCRCLLSGLLILGFVNAGLAKHQPDNDYPNDTDYQYNDDDIPSSGPVKSTISSLRSTVTPIFVDTNYTKTVKLGDNVNLECSAKNLSETNLFLWYKEKKIIIQDSNVLNPRYQLEVTNHTLIIPNAQETDSGDYICTILPQNMTLNIKLVVTNNTNEYKPAEAQSSSSIARLSLLSKFFCGTLLSGLILSCLDSLLRI